MSDWYLSSSLGLELNMQAQHTFLRHQIATVNMFLRKYGTTKIKSPQAEQSTGPSNYLQLF